MQHFNTSPCGLFVLGGVFLCFSTDSPHACSEWIFFIHTVFLWQYAAQTTAKWLVF